MAKKRAHIPKLSAIRVSGFVFDKTRPDQAACARYLLAAPFGRRQTRMRNLMIAGHQALEQRNTQPRTAPTRDDDANSND